MNASVVKPPVHVLLVEDHPLFREGLAQLVRSCGDGVHCVGVATAAEALVHLAHGTVPFDWLLTDLKLPDRDGWHLLAEVRRRWPALPCVLISGDDDVRAAERAEQWGCRAFLPKHLEPARLRGALAGVLNGERLFAAPAAPAAGARASPAAPAIELTARQREVLQRLARGLTSKAIAEELGIGERTVKDHLTVLYGRLDAGTRAEAVARAVALGLLDLADPVAG
ncbi:MAG: response regulator transcription factor [Rubrivivax sp.]|nr:response regulator transcription factor [Rubrivivax sp.]